MLQRYDGSNPKKGKYFAFLCDENNKMATIFMLYLCCPNSFAHIAERLDQ